MNRKHSFAQSAGVVAAVALLGMLRVGASTRVPGTFIALGPHGISGASHGIGVFAGAINSLVAHPTNPDIVWIGSVNGGVWKTENATAPEPHWVPKTDQQASLSIGALALDPTDPTFNTLVAGIGHFSSFGGRGGPLTGLLRTVDGGDHWTPLGEASFGHISITGAIVRDNVIVVSTTKGIWRSHDTGATFKHLGKGRKIVQGNATDLVDDPLNGDVLYTGILGKGGGVFRSDDAGVNWQNMSHGTFGQPGGANLVVDAKKIRISVHDDGTDNVVYVGIIGPDKNPSGVFRSVDRGVTWTALDIPPIEQATQGRLSILADPRFSNIVYLGGDETADERVDGVKPGPIYRCNAAVLVPGLQCTPISGVGTSDGSRPHADSRAMQFDANDDLLEVDDGGIFKNPHPRNELGFWTSVNGDLSITETHSCAWDHSLHTAVCGTQDNGTAEQALSGDAVWKSVRGADGGGVTAFSSAFSSIKYYSEQKVRNVTREVCLSLFCGTNNPSLLVNGAPLENVDLTLESYKGPTPEPIAIHPVHPNRLVIGTGFVYESVDDGETLTPLSGFFGLATRAIAYGSTTDEDILYVGSSFGLFLHTTRFGAMQQLTAYPGAAPAGIALNPADSSSAWIVDATSVMHTSNKGSTWHDMTGDLTTGAGAKTFNTIAFVPGASRSLIFVGARDGLYVMSTAHPRVWHKLSGKLPNMVVYDLDFDSADNVLLIGTLGRGAWLLANPGGIDVP
jgi:photosystem II stability/assembly factor-like uncharacterized protein